MAADPGDHAGRLSRGKIASVMVEHRGGAGGHLSAQQVAGAAGDGYTLLVTTTAIRSSGVDPVDCIFRENPPVC